MRHVFEDVVFQGAKKSNEPRALCELVDRARPAKTALGAALRDLWLADRNYCTFNVLAHLAGSGSGFILRAKDDWVARFLGYEPEGEFDVTATRYLTRSTSPKARSRPGDGHLYRELDSDQPFDALPRGSRGEYAMTLRIVRVSLRPGEDGDPAVEGDPGRWMNLVTNIPRDEFPPRLLEQTYRMRWGISRVEVWGHPHTSPSERDVRLSPHPARARSTAMRRLRAYTAIWRRAPSRASSSPRSIHGQGRDSCRP